MKNQTTNTGADLTRRKFLVGTAAAIAAAPFVGSGLHSASGAAVDNSPNAATLTERRKLGSLEVSSVGLGVQNMSRKYETTVPYRPEMINIIRAAYDRGVTFFDTARLMDLSNASASWVKASHLSATRSLSRRSSAGISILRPVSGTRVSTASLITSSVQSRGRSSGCGPIASTSSINIVLTLRCRSRMSPAP
jgi:hypothetical protein